MTTAGQRGRGIEPCVSCFVGFMPCLALQVSLVCLGSRSVGSGCMQERVGLGWSRISNR